MSTSIKELRDDELLRAVVNQITQHREMWDQTNYHSDCGTKHCVAGWAQILGGRPVTHRYPNIEAQALLGLSDVDAAWLFAGHRTLPEIYSFAKARLGEHIDGRGCDGYDRDGYDRDGYSRKGYDRAGFSRDGYNCFGRDRDGYSRGGFDHEGFDRAVFDRAGYNRAGYNLEGYDRAGYSPAQVNRRGERREYPLL